jgi:hypothetical protein
VFVNGVKLSSSDFTATNGTDITLTEAAFAGDKVEFISYATAGAGSGSVNSLNDLTDVTLTASSSGNILSYNGSQWVNTSTLSGITTVDATTVATLETALGYAPNTFNSLLISNSGISTFTGLIYANSGLDVTGHTELDNVNAGIITCTSLTASGDISAANVNTTSDRNLKENIRPVEGASELVSKLEGVHFTWKSNGQETVGVIAQQIEEHLPQLVQNGEDYKSVNYNGLIGVLIEAVKEQGAQIAALQAEIEELKK